MSFTTRLIIISYLTLLSVSSGCYELSDIDKRFNEKVKEYESYCGNPERLVNAPSLAQEYCSEMAVSRVGALYCLWQNIAHPGNSESLEVRVPINNDLMPNVVVIYECSKLKI